MIASEKVIVMDIDCTLCQRKEKGQSYLDVLPDPLTLAKLLEYRDNGFYVILFTARQMRTYQGNLGLINANTAKQMFEWLEMHNIPYDEIHFGKPWCGTAGFYVDDKAIRPSEFHSLSYEEIMKLVNP